METCDVCKLEFTAATPNEAVADAKIKGLGLWGYVCDGHIFYGVPGTITKLEERG
jgi:hypothetical protein